jgi:hypothetical protein
LTFFSDSYVFHSSFSALLAAKAKQDAALYKRLLQGKDLTDKQRAELLRKLREAERNVDLYNDMLATLMADENKKMNQLSAAEIAAQERMVEKLLRAKVLKAKKERAARWRLELQIDELFNLLSRGRTCLPPDLTVQYHCEIHECKLSHDVADYLFNALGPVTVETFLSTMQSLMLLCRRNEMLNWDIDGQDTMKMGSLEESHARVVYEANASKAAREFGQELTMGASNIGNFGSEDIRVGLLKIPDIDDFC